MRGVGHGVVQRHFARLDQLGVSGSSILVGFSGGADSTALAVVTAEARRAARLRPWLAHAQHGMRADASADVPVLLATAERLRLPISIRAIPGGAIREHAGCGPEEAMRRQRYLLLATMASESDFDAVLTGHHADDQAETVLGHLIRGSGLDGAVGMRPVTTLTVPWWPSSLAMLPLTVIRPMLGERRRDLATLVSSLDLTVVDDDTNGDVDRTRAALRHSVLPVLDSIQPDAALALARFADVARETVNAIHAAPAPVGRTQLDLGVYGDATLGARRHIVREWVRHGTNVTLSFERTEAVRQWVDGGGGRLQIGGGWSIRREGRTIIVHEDDPVRRRNET